MRRSESDVPFRAPTNLATWIVFALGAASWLGLAAVARDVEAWDSPFYFVVVLPLSIVVGAIAGRRFGGPSVRWPLAFFGGESAVIAAIWATRGVSSLWPLSCAFVFFFALPCWFAATLGVRARRARA
ncbi:MAG: hypothetical protein K8S98_07910 [Planctomycetes bacterium]|nr:hypothetical protein [Planctomycetota bacterium]